MSVPGIAFFDVDRTLLAVNSATLWVKRELRAGKITRSQALRAGMWVGAYSLGFARMDDVIRSAVAQLKGQRERDIIDRTLAFWEEEVVQTLRPSARAAVRKHRAEGDLIFLLTSSSNYLSAPLSDELKTDGFLANRFVVENGVFTGDIVEPLCYGQGKLQHAVAVAEKLRISLSDCAFYTDSIADVSVLAAVGRPVVVDPDPRLLRLAHKRRWPVLRWESRAEMRNAAAATGASRAPPTAIPPAPPPP